MTAIKTIDWSGYRWYTKAGPGIGPGPNNWSNDSNDIFVDNNGSLHLRITNKGGVWYSTEIVSALTFGYGTYIFNVPPQPYILDPNAVYGMFNYLNDCNEIDMEFSQWGNANNLTNFGFTVQPWCVCTNPNPDSCYNLTNNHKFYQPLNEASQNLYVWTPSNVWFLSKTLTTGKIESFSSNSHIPLPSTEKVHLNFWLYKGRAPQSNQPQEFIIDSFQFSPSIQRPSICSLGKLEIPCVGCVSSETLIIGGVGALLLMML